MSKEFKDCMERLFTTMASGKSWKNINRLDLFEVLFNDRQAEIDQLKAFKESASKMLQKVESDLYHICKFYVNVKSHSLIELINFMNENNIEKSDE